jgi:phosphoglycerate dehydrogenase-like enzyme
MTHVLVTAPFTEKLMNKIRGVSDDIELEQRTLPDRQWPDDWTTDAEVYYAISDVPKPEQAPNLRWVQVHWAGIDSLVDTPLWDSDIIITSASGIHAVNMAQYAFAQMLAWANKMRLWFQHQERSEWPSQRWDKFVPDELRGRTLGILGYGSIGREVARIGKAFGMTVLVTKRNVKQPKDVGYTLSGTGDPEGNVPDRIYPGEATRSMLAECDYVVVTLPLTEKTRHLFNEDLLKEMKPNAYLINVGRGGLIDEKALVRALKKGWIAGAGLDVFEEEPLPADSPLWSMENVVLTPHISGFTPHYDRRAVDLFTENLRRYLAGETLLNRVNREAGY